MIPAADTSITQSLKRIIQYLPDELPKENDPALLTGLGSVSLFYYLAGQVFQKKAYITQCVSMLDTCIERVLTQTTPDTAFANGIAGIGWLIQFLVNQSALDDQNAEGLAEVDELIWQSMEYDYQSGNYDLLHGALGKGIYCLERYQSKIEAKEVLGRLVEFLADTLITPDGKTGTWTNYFSVRRANDQQQGFDLGLAHGVSGVISFLAHLYAVGVEGKTVKSLIGRAIHWLEGQRINGKEWFFPLQLIDNEPTSSFGRLAWCYGDISVATAFFSAADALGDESLYLKGMDVALGTTGRQKENAGLLFREGRIDPTFCHGTAGIAYLYYSFSRRSKHPSLITSYKYWLELTLQATSKNEIFNPLNFTMLENEFGEHRTKLGLLEGVTGIGAVLAVFLKPELKFILSRIFQV